MYKYKIEKPLKGIQLQIVSTINQLNKPCYIRDVIDYIEGTTYGAIKYAFLQAELKGVLKVIDRTNQGNLYTLGDNLIIGGK
jgi:hypothetical protein